MIRDAAAVILLRHNTDAKNPEVFLVRRSPKLSFLGGYHAFPGGQFDETDSEAPVENCADSETRTAVACAARELFEETGVLIARGGETLTQGQRASLLDDLQSGRMSWPKILRHYKLHLDGNDFTFVGRWVTPPFSARRFDTWFFLINCPPKQRAEVAVDGELDFGDWTPASEALARWQRPEILAVPPVIHALRTLSGGITDDLVQRFLSNPNAHREPVRRIEFRPNYICFPVRTPTKPPATHTNSYLIYTSEELLVIDPGSPYEDEQQALANAVGELVADGRLIKEIILTHMHPDHVGGVGALREQFPTVNVAAHRLTAEPLSDTVPVDRLIEDNDVIELKGSPAIRLQALHTPGHAQGHLCFYEARTGTLISGDNIVGLGSVLIEPEQGNMRDYLQSLQRMRQLPDLSVIFGGHGPAMGNPYEKIDEYISHRLEREQSILRAINDGAATVKEIVARVYTDISPKAHPMAERAVLAHLEKLIEDGVLSPDSLSRLLDSVQSPSFSLRGNVAEQPKG
ncbi:MAG TPA: MBL fold metallo-hydrolase [Pyrinomonadaceae bacterium]